MWFALAPPLVHATRVWLSTWQGSDIAAATVPTVNDAVVAREAPSIGVRIIVGSNSGTGEMLARALRAEAREKGFDVELVDVAALPSVQLPSQLSDMSALATAFGTPAAAVTIIIVATYGEGEPTEPCRELHASLKAAARMALVERNAGRHISLPLSGMNFAVFGLGDSSYKYFARAGVEFADYIKVLGGNHIVALGKGDARRGTEDAFDQWREAMWEPLAAAAVGFLTPVHGNASTPQAELQFAFRDDLPPAGSPFPSRPSAMEPNMKYPYAAKVKKLEVLVQGNRADGTRRTLNVGFDVSLAPIAFQGGDHLGVLPCNPDDVVDRCLVALRVPAEDWTRTIELTSSARSQRRATPLNVLPAATTLREALRWYVALTMPPRKSVLRILARYCSDARQADAIVAAMSDAVQFAAFVGKHRTIVDVLEAFGSCRIPVGHFVEVMPRIAPRYYSVASDMTTTRDCVDIVFVLADGGLCSGMLNSLAVGAVVHLFVRHSTFHLSQAKKASPVIMVGAGTGVAPYFGFAERRSFWLRKGMPIGDCRLYFGCRRSAVDYLGKDAWERYKSEGAVTDLRVAFSRDDPTSAVKYVQHVLKLDAAYVYDAMEKQNGFLYVCGDAAGMAAEVEQVLKETLVAEGGMSDAEAAKAISRWERSGRYLKDVWSSAAAK